MLVCKTLQMERKQIIACSKANNSQRAAKANECTTIQSRFQANSSKGRAVITSLTHTLASLNVKRDHRQSVRACLPARLSMRAGVTRAKVTGARRESATRF